MYRETLRSKGSPRFKAQTVMCTKRARHHSLKSSTHCICICKEQHSCTKMGSDTEQLASPFHNGIIADWIIDVGSNVISFFLELLK